MREGQPLRPVTSFLPTAHHPVQAPKDVKTKAMEILAAVEKKKVKGDEIEKLDKESEASSKGAILEKHRSIDIKVRSPGPLSCLSHGPHDLVASSACSQTAFTKASQEVLDLSITEWAICAGVSFNALQHPKFKKILRDARGVSDRYGPPSRSRMGGDLLDTHFARAKEVVDDKLADLDLLRCTITSDGLTYQHTKFENFFLLKNGRRVFLGCEDCSEHMSEGGIINGTFVAEALIERISEVGARRVIQLVLDGASENEVAAEIVVAKWAWIIASHCLSHRSNLFMQDVGKIGTVRALLRDSEDLINFCHVHTGVYAQLMKECRAHLGKELGLIKAADTRFAGKYIGLHRVRRLKAPLRALAASAEFQNRNLPDENALTKVLDKDWWKRVDELLLAVWPAYKLLRIADTDKPVASKVAPYIDNLLDHLRRREDESQYGSEILKCAEDRFVGFCSDLHLAAYYLDPSVYQEVYGAGGPDDIAGPIMNMAERIFYGDEGCDAKVAETMADLGMYMSMAAPIFGRKHVWEAAKAMSAAEWWRVYGGSMPRLREVAMVTAVTGRVSILLREGPSEVQADQVKEACPAR
jgi:hypothetical protein